jgi:crotonobetainyl-CoA:carnitine CoA-transferase CaiB-like acyl-CoA transferase
MADQPLEGLRVVELAEDPAGELTGYLLAMAGADVLKLEPPAGSPTRATGPFRAGAEGYPEQSLCFWYYNSNKKSAVRDISGQATLEPLLADADILLTTWQPAELARRGLELDALEAKFPRLIILSVTPFGLTGPWKDYRSSELVGLAAGGPLIMCGYDDHSIPPVLPGGNQAYHIAASFALKAVLVALLDRQRSALGQLVDVSMHEACAVTVELANPYWFYPKALVRRQTCRHAQPSPTQTALFECADGRHVYFALVLAEAKPWSALVEWMEEFGMAAHLSDPRFAQFSYRQEHYPDVQTIVECFFLIHDADTVFKEGQRRGLPIAIITAPEELFDDEHEKARRFFVEVDHGEAGVIPYPGPPIRFSAMDTAPRTRAPKLGEHDEELGR